MSVYYYRGVAIAAPLTIESNEPFFVSDTLSLRQERVFQGAQRWELSFTLKFRDDEDSYMSSIFSADNNSETMTMPQLLTVDKKASQGGVLTVATGAAVNASSVMVSASSEGYLVPKGSFVTFEGHTKVYLVREDFIGGDTATPMLVYPNLVEPAYISDVVAHPGSAVKPQLTYYTSTETLRGVTYEDGVLIDPGTIKLIEAV